MVDRTNIVYITFLSIGLVSILVILGFTISIFSRQNEPTEEEEKGSALTLDVVDDIGENVKVNVVRHELGSTFDVIDDQGEKVKLQVVTTKQKMWPLTKRFDLSRPRILDDGLVNMFLQDVFNSKINLEHKEILVPVISFSNNVKVCVCTSYHNFKTYVETKHQQYQDKYENLMTIMVDGEPNSFDVDRYDVCVSTKLDIVEKYPKKVVYLPYVAAFVVEFEMIVDLHGIRAVPSDWNQRTLMFFGYSNTNFYFTGVNLRGKFYREAKRRFGLGVRNMGRSEHEHNDRTMERHVVTNDGDFKKSEFVFGSNRHMQKKFRFAIVFENEAIRGYVTEKIMNPLLAGCIPIYYGAPDITRWINPECFIHVRDFANWQDCFDRIEEVNGNPVLQQQILSAPIFTQEFINGNPGSFIRGKGCFYKQLFSIMPSEMVNMARITRAYDQNIATVTFADGIACNSDRIYTEMQECGYFDLCYKMSTTDLPLDFQAKWGQFMGNNQKGFGYYIWKPKIIQTVFNMMSEGDIIVWLDAGMHIKPEMGSDVMSNYYDRLTKSEHDILAFEIKYLEADWNKRDLVELIQARYGDVIFEHKRQLCTGVLMLQKSDKSQRMLEEWVEISQLQQGHFIDNSPSVNGKELPNFIDHRHDQSIFSLLAKSYGCVISSDNITDDHTSDDMIFQPRRWRQ